LEFERLAGTNQRFADLALPGWIDVLPDPAPLSRLIVEANLDAGESAAIALCLNEKADALLIDEAGFWVSPGLRAKVLQAVGE
jgi:predicted nucleic acid-binding protein